MSTFINFFNTTLRPPYLRVTLYPLYRMLGGPQSRYGRVRKTSPLTRIQSPDRPARSGSLYGLLFRGPLVYINVYYISIWYRYVVPKHRYLPINAAQHSRRGKISFSPRSKPETTHSKVVFEFVVFVVM
jgi:hypothetical protein